MACCPAPGTRHLHPSTVHGAHADAISGDTDDGVVVDGDGAVRHQQRPLQPTRQTHPSGTVGHPDHSPAHNRQHLVASASAGAGRPQRWHPSLQRLLHRLSRWPIDRHHRRLAIPAPRPSHHHRRHRHRRLLPLLRHP